MPINLVDNFNINSELPIDGRIIASNSTIREAIEYKYDGLKVFQLDIRKNYIWNGNSEEWEEDTNVNGSGTTYSLIMWGTSTQLADSPIRSYAKTIYEDNGKILVGSSGYDGAEAFQINSNYSDSTNISEFGTSSMPLVIHKGGATTSIGHNWYYEIGTGDNYFNSDFDSSILDLSEGGFTFRGSTPSSSINTLIKFNKNGSIQHGSNTFATASGGHAEGEWTYAQGMYSHTEGYGVVSRGIHSHGEGQNTYTIGAYSHAEGIYSISRGNASHAEGISTEAIGVYSHAEGDGTLSIGGASHAEGIGTSASGDAAHSEGDTTHASGFGSHAEGVNTNAIGAYSHAEGGNSYAVGVGSHAEGYNSNAGGQYSHAEGTNTNSYGFSSHAEGQGSAANGAYSHSGGNATIASYDYMYAIGVYNSDPIVGTYSTPISGTYSKALFVIGNGSLSGRSNVFEVLTDRVLIKGIIEYTDNATAILAGLTAGTLYRTGENLKVVY